MVSRGIHRYEKFATIVTSLGFVSSHHYSALFVKHSSAGRILLSLYVDDMIITGDDSVGIESLKLELAHRFAIKDLGLLCYFLRIEVAFSPKGYILSQSKYIGDLLDRARITDKMVKDIPIDAKAKYTPTDGDPLPDSSLYRTIVGNRSSDATQVKKITIILEGWLVTMTSCFSLRAGDDGKRIL
ncbi:uncharacterized mitochondrial protein-like protein [Tanacetum coccineum]